MWDLVTVKNSHEIIRHKDNVSHKIDKTKKLCSGKQHNFVPIGIWFKHLQWQVVFAIFCDLSKMLTCGTKIGL
jgi:hypothetical protein